ncbi:MAG: FAD-dependent oxidoreductase, partial [Vicinamibacteria bacterium]
MNRRTFLRFAAANVGLAALGARQDTPSRSPDVIVVGAGAFGGWTALSLREMGFSVILVDAYGPGNSRASSGGETRQIRVGYGEREIYSRWVLKAFERWKAREDEWGIKLLLPTGRLLLASEWTDSLKATERVLDKLGVETEV